MRPSLFLDTTLQIRRVLTGRADQDRLEAQLIDLAPGLCTAAYVWMEYQRTVIADYAHVHQLVLNYDHWGDVMAHLLTGQRAFRPRAAVRCTHILGQLYAESQADWERALHLLNHAVSFDLKSQFWAHVAPLSDPIGCDLVQSGIARQPDGVYTVADACRKDTANCRLPNFLAERQPELRAIAQHLATHPNAIKDQLRVERLLAAVLADARAALGQAACWPLGFVESSAERRCHHRPTSSPRHAALDARQARFCCTVGPPRSGTLHVGVHNVPNHSHPLPSPAEMS